MLTAHHLTKSYGLHTVLQDISFSISARERIGLIGPNGCGKTTLMRILAGLEAPDKGTVAQTRAGLRIGYLAQGLELAPRQTIEATLGLSSVKQTNLETEFSALAQALAHNPGDSAIQSRFDAALAHLSTFNLEPATVLGPLGLGNFPLETPVSHLSGGQKTRLMLARVLIDDPHLLLLDEPTNHLDIAMLEWLETWLNGFHGAALIVSHDRAFLDNTVTSILELDPATQGLKAYPGNYSDYFEQKLAEQERQMNSYLDQQAEISRMKQDIARTKQQSVRVELSTTPRQPGVRRIAKKVAKKALAREKKLERFLESDNLVEKPRPSWQLKLDFAAPAHQSKNVLITEALSIGYAPEKPLLTGLDLHIRAGQRIAVTGPNGAGKTTLLRTIAGKLEPIAGSLRLGTSVRLGYMAQEQEMLDLTAMSLRGALFATKQSRHPIRRSLRRKNRGSQ